MFSQIDIKKWRQFDEVSIEFSKRVTIITGANGAGKTTLLNILNKHLGWGIQFVSTPKKEKESGIVKYFTDIWESFFSRTNTNQYEIGRIRYKNGSESKLMIPNETSMSFSIEIQNMQQVNGIFIPSHRPINSYQSVDSIPTTLQNIENLYDDYNGKIINRYLNPQYGSESPIYTIKKALISLATFGYDSKVVQGNSLYAELYSGFESILARILPSYLGFRRLEVRVPELVLITESGDFSIDAVSGGVSSLIVIAWAIYLFSKKTDEFVVIIDEPENHLHPAMQREILPKLAEAFPNVKFIVSTHSPFIVTSVFDSRVYALKYVNNKVKSTELNLVDKTSTATKVLRDVLEVPITIPIWIENKMIEISSKYTEKELSDETLRELKRDLIAVNLQDFVPESVKKIMELRK